jgi:hypothetical protein
MDPWPRDPHDRDPRKLTEADVDAYLAEKDPVRYKALLANLRPKAMHMMQPLPAVSDADRLYAQESAVAAAVRIGSPPRIDGDPVEPELPRWRRPVLSGPEAIALIGAGVVLLVAVCAGLGYAWARVFG